jgi:predicted transcriptional regulator
MHEQPPHSDLNLAERLAQKEQHVLAAEAQIDRGEYVTLEAMMAWVDSVGTDHELPPPRPALPLRPPLS